MKTIKKLFLVVALAFVAISVKAQDKRIQFTDLPKAAQNFVTTYYAANQVSRVKMDKDLLSTSYEVKLKNGVEIEFDGNGNWTEVDAKKKAVPQQIVNPKILSYVKKSFPNNEIVEISLSGRKIKVELTNGLDLVFNKKGEFVGIDD